MAALTMYCPISIDEEFPEIEQAVDGIGGQPHASIEVDIQDDSDGEEDRIYLRIELQATQKQAILSICFDQTEDLEALKAFIEMTLARKRRKLCSREIG